MGSSASSLSADVPGADLRLPVSGLKFTTNQLQALNSYVDTLNEEDQKGRISTELEYAVESLVQRIVDGAGQRDPRFRCCHLIALHRGKKMRSRSLEYLVTLDSLPTLNVGEDCLQDGPVGYGKVRLSPREAEKWEEFVTPTGYLCKDKILERWVQLIARCTQARGGGGSRVLCARAAQLASPHHYCYLERAQPPQTTNDKRLAIVEGAAWVMVRVGAGEAEAKLMLGVRVDGGNASAYTTRVPLTHPLALLHYTSGQGGYYAVAVGPPTSVVCNERASTWQLWHPSLEANLDAHWSEVSTVARIAGALNALLDRMRDGGYQGSLRVLSRYAVCCALRRRLQAVTSPLPAARAVLSSHAAHHLLMVLDSLLYLCEKGGPAGYVYPVEKSSVVRRGSRASDWSCDATCIRSCLLQLHQIAGEDIPPTPVEALETALFSKWSNLNKESKSCSSLASHSRRQLRYLARAASELMRCKSLVVFENHSTFRANLLQATSLNQEAVEDLIHVLAIMLDQARDSYLNNNFQMRNFGEFDRGLSAYRSKKWNKLKEYYDASSACLIDAVRRDLDVRKEDLTDGLVLMKQALSWLHKGAKDDKKYLGPVLKPYLEALFAVSLENSLFLDDFYGAKCESEFEGLKDYCSGVHDGKLEPCIGLLEAAKKQAWAKAMVDFVDRFRHIEFRLVFPTGDGLAVSYPVKLPSKREHSSARVLTLSRRDKVEAKLRLARRCVLGAFAAALVGELCLKPKPIPRHGSSDEILASVKSGNYWRNNTKPDIIPSTSVQDISSLDQPKLRRRSRRCRPMTSYGYPEISITNQSDTKTMRRKYHTLKSLVYTEPVENIRELRRRPRSAGNSMRNKEAMSRPSILETLDFINSVKDTLNVEESGLSDAEDTAWSLEEEWMVCQTAPLNLLAARCGAHAMHLTLADLVPALLRNGRFTILQELCSYLSEPDGALFAVHRLARAARSRSSERSTNSWRLPECPESGVPQYRARSPDHMSGDEAPTPPPLPRRDSYGRQIYLDYQPPKRLQDLEKHLSHLELMNSKLNLQTPQDSSYTGIINPIYDVKIPRDKFIVKRSKSLGRSFSTKNLGLEITRYNLTLGHKSGKRTNDVVTAINGMTGETGLELKGNFFQRSSANVVGDSYRVSKVTID